MIAALLAATALAPGGQQTPFEVLSVSPDLRMLTVGYLTGPCWRDLELGASGQASRSSSGELRRA